MPLIYVGVGILMMLFFLMVVKLDAFFSILITTFAVGLLNGINIKNNTLLTYFYKMNYQNVYEGI